MYFRQAEHDLPHIHAIYGECIGAIDIKMGHIDRRGLAETGVEDGAGVDKTITKLNY